MNTAAKYLFIALAGCLLFFPFLGRVHLFDWDEINFAECAREMILTKDYLRVQIDFQPFWEKPPLFIWLQVLSMKLFGVNEYSARFPDAVAGVATLLTLYYAGRRIVNERMASWWVLLYASTWLPHFYFKSGIIDPVFNLFIFISVFQMYLVRFGRRQIVHAVLAGAFLGLAVLTKGPVALLVSGLAFVTYLVLNRGFVGYKASHIALVAIMAILVTASWFGVEIAAHGWGLVKEFLDYQAGLFSQNIADHEQPWYYHPIVLLIGCFPASLFLFQYSRRQSNDPAPCRHFTRWMWILFWVVLILFSIVKTKIVHYSSLCYFPLTFLAAVQLYRINEGSHALKRWVVWLVGAVGSLIALAIMLLPVVGMYKELLIPYIKDDFAVGNLQAQIAWHWTESLWGAFYLVGIVVCCALLRKHFRRAMIALCILQILIIEVAVVHFTPKIEGYTQRAAVEFFQQLEGKDVYVQVLGYKSYAHLFYTKKPGKPSNPNYYKKEVIPTKDGASIESYVPNEAWLLTGVLDKPAYFVCKTPDAVNYESLPTLKKLGSKNGFTFFMRK